MVGTAAKVLRWAYLGWRWASIWMPVAEQIVCSLNRYPYGRLTPAEIERVTGSLRAAIERSPLALPPTTGSPGPRRVRTTDGDE